MHRAIVAKTAAPRAKSSNYPEPFASRMEGRVKRPLGDLYGLTNFGVNLTALAPGGLSSLFHSHSRQDEFVYVLEGDLVLITANGEQHLQSGMCFGFPAGGTAHHLVNRSDQDAVFLEIGDRSAGDQVSYPNDDIQAVVAADGKWAFARKDGTPY